MENSQALFQTQQQTQQLTPVQLQGLNLLAAPLHELENVLAGELANNPLLEAVLPNREELAGDPIEETAAAGNELDRSEFEGANEEFPLLDSFSEAWSDSADIAGSAEYDNTDSRQKKIDYRFNSLTVQESLTDKLFEQLNFCTLLPEEYSAAELVIGSLDEKGFLTTHLADLAMSGNFSMQTMEKALQCVQGFDPPGVGARSVVESLMIQLKRRNYPDKRIYDLLKNHQDELERNKLPQIAKSMKVSLNELYAMLDDLKKLNAVPAAGMSGNTQNSTVLPEMSIELENGEIKVSSRGQHLPRLTLVTSYLKLLEDPLTNEETRQYLREKLASAENLIKSLDLRQDTISRITDVIVRKQSEFFRYGVEKLQPLTMQEVADILEVHETTVSRAVSGKYLETPQGLLEYRFFFSGGYKNAEGGDVSSRVVKEKIRELIANENPRKPLSDAAIAAQLSADGLDVARRTVAKYRESMNIPATNLRRKH